jgi:hypothetical protein
MSSHTLDDRTSASPDDPGGRPPRRGPHALVTLAAFAGLVLGAMTVVILLLTLARLVQRVV